MRRVEERRDIVTSIRLSEKQRDEIEEKASAHHMTMGTFMMHAALNANAQFDPVVLTHAQNILNIAMRLAQKYEPETIKEIMEEENAIWST